MKLPWKQNLPTLKQEDLELAGLWWPYAAGRKLLVIDDQPLYRTYLETLLRRAGYEVISASDGEEAVRKARAETPDVIVMDRKLPAFRRFRALNRLADDPATTTVPVVMPWLRAPGNFLWRGGDENVAAISREPATLLDVLRRLDIAAVHRKEASQGTWPPLIQSPEDSRPGGQEPKRILVADAERHVARFMETLLRGAGYEVIPCNDGDEAVERAKSEPPDVVTFGMLIVPRFNWLSAFSELRTDPATANVPRETVHSRRTAGGHRVSPEKTPLSGRWI